MSLFGLFVPMHRHPDRAVHLTHHTGRAPVARAGHLPRPLKGFARRVEGAHLGFEGGVLPLELDEALLRGGQLARERVAL